MEGEFAFILVDIVKDNIKVYYGRDRFGIRPLFSYIDKNSFYFSSELKGLPFDGLGNQVQPRKIFYIDFINSTINDYEYYKINNTLSINNLNNDDYYFFILNKIKLTLTESVRNMMQTERPLGALLSGGLDSSLIAGIAAKILREKGERLNTFSIGIEEDAPDIQYARKVSKHINSIHHEIIIPVEKWINNLKNVIKQIETYDITTIRASTGQYLIGKWIKENTDIKVLLNGDGSDELTSGYLYFYNASSPEEAHKENINLLSQIHNYDVLRVDRGISAWGLEARVPFLSHKFVDMYLGIDPSLRNPIKGKRIEKSLLRNAFIEENIIPKEVLLRQKEAFSDAVSNKKKSWYEYIEEHVKCNLDLNDINISKKFPSIESWYYYLIFKQYYPKSKLEVKYWMPKWTNEHNGDPSARKLKSLID